ncbi:hypothetical protein UFOVP67_11 [uncultured Caudovirales phage]|uniref:Uncharacterized protein n=1 Tax=uncultured Caudovirales phage TaxID=2100421 RepID=A0A6J5TAJ3_9CAUD|nr:hypothetical protein UFOVP67_11 [uncultured Caudovirales phage]
MGLQLSASSRVNPFKVTILSGETLSEEFQTHGGVVVGVVSPPDLNGAAQMTFYGVVGGYNRQLLKDDGTAVGIPTLVVNTIARVLPHDTCALTDISKIGVDSAVTSDTTFTVLVRDIS